MGTAFFTYVRRMWMSSLPDRLIHSILVAALFEALVYLVNARIRRALTPVLNRDAGAEPTQRAARRKVVLGIPTLVVRWVLYTIAVLIILDIFRLRLGAVVLPVGLAVLALAAIAGRRALVDVVAGYFIHYDYLYAIGDEITVGEASGMVSEIGLRHTRLRTRDGQEIVVPHGQVAVLLNRTGLKRRSGEQ